MEKIKTALQILKDKFLLIEDDKTCECHTHLVVEAMEEYKSQGIVSEKELKEDKTFQLVCSQCGNKTFRCYVTLIIDDARFYCEKCGYLELN